MRMIIATIVLVIFVCCSGFPTQEVTRALDASLDQLNSQSWGRNLLKVSRTGKMKVKPLLQIRDRWDDGEVFEVNLKFSVRETSCAKDTTSDPKKCEFREGPNVETPCESQSLVSHKQAIVVKARCNLLTSSSSESHSSEEFPRKPSSPQERLKRKPERISSQWNLRGRKSQNIVSSRLEKKEKNFDAFLLE